MFCGNQERVIFVKTLNNTFIFVGMHILFIVALFSPIPNSVSIKMFSCPLCAYKKNKIYYQTKTLREIQNHATTKLCPPELSDICVNTMNTKAIL